MDSVRAPNIGCASGSAIGKVKAIVPRRIARPARTASAADSQKPPPAGSGRIAPASTHAAISTGDAPVALARSRVENTSGANAVESDLTAIPSRQV